MRRIWDAKVLLSVMVSGLATLFLTVFVLAGSVIMERGLHMTFLMPRPYRLDSLGNTDLADFSVGTFPFCLFLVQETGVLVMVIISVG